VLCQYLDVEAGIAYNDDQRDAQAVRYTDPNDLFLTGAMDSRRGTCGNMAALQLALGWRLGWPVSLAKAWWHTYLRFDNGEAVWNVEATDTGRGGFCCHTDAYLMQRDQINPEHVRSGSDLTTLRPRQLLGEFLGARGRHLWDVRQVGEAQQDFALALGLYPQSRVYRHMLQKCQLYGRIRDNLHPRRVQVPIGIDYSTVVTFGIGGHDHDGLEHDR
jgi:hypothetical protein